MRFTGRLQTIVGADGTAESQFDFSLAELDRKNELNKLGDDTFAVMRDHDEPYFTRVQEFLGNPLNADLAVAYHEVVDEIRRRVAAEQQRFDRFEDLLEQIYYTTRLRFPSELRNKLRTLRVLISFMYFSCDIGRKQ